MTMPTTQRSAPATFRLSGLLCFFHLLGFVYLCAGDFPQGGHDPGCRDNEREALLRFKRGLPHDPAHRLSSWMAGSSDCCGWSGVGCDNRTGHVVTLDLRNPVEYLREEFEQWRLGGEISPSLLDLKHLAHLDLSGNNFSERPIPEFMGSIRRLKYLNLSRAGLRGIIPHHLGNLSKLQSLDLSMDSGSLTLDDARWVSRLSSLRQVNMEYVLQVTSSESSNELLEALNMLPFISSVNLRSCGLKSLPPLPHVNFTSLLVLDLSFNSIQSPIPEWLPNITTLEYLDLGYNQFQGRIPSALWIMSSLKVLDMSGNEGLDGKIPRNLSSLCKLQKLGLRWINIGGDVNELEGTFSGCIRSSLQSLDFGSNRLNGSFPSWLAGLKKLKQLSLRWNSLQGPIPEFLGRISSLEELDLSNNSFNGNIPENLGGLSRLTSLYLNKNHLQGSIPETLGNISSLQTLYLQGNSLSGSIPESLGGLSSLEGLSLGHNNLSGTIPQSLFSLSRLQILDVSFNYVGGTVTSAHFSNFKNLDILAMASNPIVFNISSSWIPPFRLLVADMGSCKLGPLFPTWLRLHQYVVLLNLSNSEISDINVIPDSYWSSTSSIEYLDLSNNLITGRRLLHQLKHIQRIAFVNLRSNHLGGEVPQLSSKDVYSLDLSNNLFMGAIPEDLGEVMPSLKFLSLSNNTLNGTIPGSLCRLQKLKILDLSKNSITGNIPDCWKSSSSYALKVLNLASNSLVGVIPKSLGSLFNLVTLKLNNNSLSGKFPPSLRNCANMSILDLSENKLSGNIPSWVAESMPSLKVLILRSNKFTGNIPPNLSSLTYLLVVDLANNDLVSTIPQSFGNFIAMKSIHNLSNTSTSEDIYTEIIEYVSGVISVSLGVLREKHKDIVRLMIKGRMLEYQKLPSVPISIDFSNNRLFGSIPEGLANLVGLNSFNVSGNMIIGQIMQNISSLRQLESLDLSRNNLSGMIPASLTSLTFLSQLNLSFNNFSGMIPEANQFHTFTDLSYMGNPFLCGLPLVKPCEGGGKSADSRDYKSHESKGHGDNDMVWMYLCTALGFILGFWAVCGTLIMHKRWRIIFFVLIDDMSDQLYVFIVFYMRKLRTLWGMTQWQH